MIAVGGLAMIAGAFLNYRDEHSGSKEISVRIHGTDHATVPNMRVTVILAVFGAALAVYGVWLVLRPPGTRRTRPA